MGQSLTRRVALGALGFGAPAIALARSGPAEDIAALERRAGGRLGVAAVDTGSGRWIRYRAGERFPMCSTFKTLLAAAVLQRVDRGKEHLDRWITYNNSIFPGASFYAPATRAHVGEGGMTAGDLCAAAVSWSDNGAANLLLASIGGPPAVTRYARSLGDRVTRLDHNETRLNVFTPGDPRDTTSPSAMLGDLKELTLGRALSEASRTRLVTWLADCRTAGGRIPAGLPKGWRSGNKTGSWPEQGSTNDVAILWPPGRAPILVAAYYMDSSAPDSARDAVLADVGRIVSTRL